MPRYIAVIPAAGTGTRMGDSTPKQYLPIAKRPLLYYALAAIAAHPLIDCVFVVLAAGDARFRTLSRGEFGTHVETLYCGGATRAASVYNGLLAGRDAIFRDDWVLVHDAARPCLSPTALARLIDEVGDDKVGGLLAVPVADTLKRSTGEDRVLETAPRSRLWQAQTPQMFRYGTLVEALRRAGPNVTDEAVAVERLGLQPKLVMGEVRNLKVTYPEDLALARLILQAS